MIPRPGTASRTRAYWRTKCRQLISEHIGRLMRPLSIRVLTHFSEKELGLKISADKVRLVPRPDDPYQWVCLPARTHLFDKPLSKHNTGAYKEVCRELGQSLGVRARLANDDQMSPARPKTDQACPQTADGTQDSTRVHRLGPDTFITMVERLRRSNTALREVVAGLKTDLMARDRLNTTLQRKHKELAETTMILQANLESSRKELLASEARTTTLELQWTKTATNVERCQEAFSVLHGQLTSALQS